MNITIITGWIAAILLFFNFATCIAMPWINKLFKKCVEDEKEHCHAAGILKYHRPIVYLSIIAIIVHIIISIIY
ncbi:MAG: hypothetical protein ABIH37_04780 [archaeon]